MLWYGTQTNNRHNVMVWHTDKQQEQCNVMVHRQIIDQLCYGTQINNRPNVIVWHTGNNRSNVMVWHTGN